MKLIITLVFSIAFIASCSFYDDFQELVAEAEDFKKSLKDNHGMSPLVNSNLHNGRLHVTTTLDVDRVGEMTVKEVYEILHQEAGKAYTHEITSLTISITD